MELFKEKTRIEAECAKVVAEVQDRELIRLAGCASDVAWLSTTTGVPRAEASKTVRVARELNDEVAPTLDAWSSGDLTSEKAATICKAINTLPDWVDEPARGAAQAHLLELARTFSSEDLKRLANHVIEVIDPETLNDQIGIATLSTGNEMSASQARRFACNSRIIPMVLSGTSEVLDLGRSEGEWRARMAPDGIVEVIPPTRIDPDQKPLRHNRFRNGPWKRAMDVVQDQALPRIPPVRHA